MPWDPTIPQHLTEAAVDQDQEMEQEHLLDMLAAHDPQTDPSRYAELLRTGSVRADGYIDPALWNEDDWRIHDERNPDPTVVFHQATADAMRTGRTAAPTDEEVYNCRDCYVYEGSSMVLPHRPGGDPATWEVWAPRIPGIIERRLVDMVPCDRHLEQQHRAAADEDGV